ncbi:gustatory receptor 68a-like [Ostrinia furnacalis]|uniref:gustatory receptor 68a-like n=1 Tax=Ostrinia furnacalis TaxID=93504 RepID=UPI00103C81B8|nr:gustatory receptor 68a-like [Ostrinia furnacalis]
MIALFSPCMFGDQVHCEVRRLRELLASRLYENKLDKSGRSAARALLALTEAQDLSFSLLRMFQVDISLPFKFIGLLVTYLIILLQFEKVINPTPTSTSTEMTLHNIYP